MADGTLDVNIFHLCRISISSVLVVLVVSTKKKDGVMLHALNVRRSCNAQQAHSYVIDVTIAKP